MSMRKPQVVPNLPVHPQVLPALVALHLVQVPPLALQVPIDVHVQSQNQLQLQHQQVHLQNPSA